jgi:predicted hydrocarbon binding protein
LSETLSEELAQVQDSETVPAFGYELIREVLIPELLGSDTPEILYWAGKKLARKFPLQSFTEIIDFFKRAGWGDLSIKSETKSEFELELSSNLITKRMKNQEPRYFQIEAGFLAEQIEIQKQVIAETFEHPKKRNGKVSFTVKWDKKDSI